MNLISFKPKDPMVAIKGEKQLAFQRKLMEEIVWEIQGCANIMQDEMANGIRKVVNEVLCELYHETLGKSHCRDVPSEDTRCGAEADSRGEK